jgi:hypothetical protein
MPAISDNARREISAEIGSKRPIIGTQRRDTSTGRQEETISEMYGKPWARDR